MPTINDATVVSGAYQLGGNGGRKLVRLSNGWLISAVGDTNSSKTNMNIYVSKDEGASFSLLTYLKISTNTSATVIDVALTSVGNKVYGIMASQVSSASMFYYFYFDSTTVPSTIEYNTLVNGSYYLTIDSGQTACNYVSIASNSLGTELHATWSSKNSTYPNSFNIRYAKGTINADGSVTWGAVVQVTKDNNSAGNNQNPTVVTYKDGEPIIISQSSSSSSYQQVLLFSPTGLPGSNPIYSPWTFKLIYDGTSSYTQSSPSAIFVPQSVNGLVNGRIWVAWHGTDATDTAKQNVRVSYSDDGGVTWSAMQKLTSGNTIDRDYASITANKSNEIFLTYEDGTGVSQMKNTAGVWGSATTKVSTGSAPSTLYDPTLNFTEPSFIYKSSTKVGFFVTRAVTTTISPLPGHVGAVSDGSNLLNYTITTDDPAYLPTVLVADTFNRADSSTTLGTTTTGSKTWQSYGTSNVWGITGNTAYPVTPRWDYPVYVDAGASSNLILSIKVSMYHHYQQIFWRIVDDKNYWVLQGEDVYRSINGTWVKMATLTTDIIDNDVVRVELVNDTHKVYVNGMLGATVVDSTHQSGTKFGMSSQNGSVRFDDFKIETMAGLPIVEKVNGVTVNNKSSNSGQAVVAGVTQAQWDAVKYGNYSNNTGSLNSLEILAGTEKFTYTFDKRLPNDADLQSIIKATQDAQSTHLPAVKSKLASAITSKGGTATGADSWDTLVSAVGGITLGKKMASGTATPTAPSGYWQFSVSGLSFKPSIVYYRTKNPVLGSAYASSGVIVGSDKYVNNNSYSWKGIGFYGSLDSIAALNSSTTGIYITEGGFATRTWNEQQVEWWAYE